MPQWRPRAATNRFCSPPRNTATAFAAAVASFYAGVPVAHVEAGLRTGDLASPFPEEFHRRAIAAAAALHLAPTAPPPSSPCGARCSASGRGRSGGR